MKVILKKSWTNKFGRKYPIGQFMRVDKELGQYLKENGYAEDTEIKGTKPAQKVKTDFFKPKLK